MKPASVAKVIGAWLPFYAIWMLFILTWVETATLGDAMMAATSSIGIAAFLGFGVWYFTGWLEWPDQLRPGFYLAQFAAGLAFAVLWQGIGYMIEWAGSGVDPITMVRQSRVLVWQLLMGLLMYSLTAGVSHLMRVRERLDHQRNLAARAETLARDAQLRALRAQLDPHFLFNALHSVSALITTAPDRAELAIEQLGDMLRYTLDEHGHDRTTFAEEWEFTERYIELERLRWSDRLSAALEMESGAGSCDVPVFSLQALVENAVKHNMGDTVSSLSVNVRASLDGDDLVIRVSDDGAGLTETRENGIGLNNLSTRLEGWAEGPGRLSVQSNNGTGCTVELRIPQAR